MRGAGPVGAGPGAATLALLCAAALWAPAAGAAWTPVHDYRGAVPVLCYHGVHTVADASADPYSISRDELARQLEMLAAAGFETISAGQYARFAAGDATGLPNRPILITFDDGRLDSYLAADPLLARYGMRATMFVITANAAAAKPGYLGWPTLAALARTGRWDLQEHAHAGHVQIATGPGGRTGPYYANLRWADGRRETFTAFKRRVSGDVLAGRRLMAAMVPGFEPLAFAPPYGTYGQSRTNYAPIPSWERSWLLRTFRVLFVQDHARFNLPGDPVGQRYAIRGTTTAAALYAWLRSALPRSAWVAPLAAPPKARTRPRRPSLRRLVVGARRVVLVFRRRHGVAVTLTRTRAGRRHAVHVRVGSQGRARDRRLRPRTRYVYRARAVDRDGRRSRVLRLRVTTRAAST